MSKKLSKILLSAVLLLLVTSAVPANATVQTASGHRSSGGSIVRLIDDPELRDTVNIVREGSRSDFGGQQMVNPENESDGIVVLHWYHSGEELDWDQGWGAGSPLPPALDYVYFTKSFQWSQSVTPTRVDFQLTFSVSATGDFAGTTGQQLYYHLYLWLITGGTDWHLVYKSSPPYDFDRPQMRTIALDAVQVNETFGAALKSADNPEITIALGLGPASSFRGLDTTTNGRVEFIIDQFRGEALVQTEDDDLSPTLTPAATVEFGLRNYTDVITSMTVDATDGSCYIAGATFIVAGKWLGFLAKVGPQGNLVWQRNLTTYGDMIPFSVIVQGQRVIVVGAVASLAYADSLFVSIWNGDGQEQSSWTRPTDPEISRITAAPLSDGSIVVVTAVMGSFPRSAVTRLSLTNETIWTAQYENDALTRMCVDENDNIYLVGNSHIVRFDSEGNKVWEMMSLPSAIIVLPDGPLVLASPERGNNVDIVSRAGAPISSRAVVREYSDISPDMWDDNDLTGLAASADGTFYVVGLSRIWFGAAYLYRLDKDLNILGNWTLPGLVNNPILYTVRLGVTPDGVAVVYSSSDDQGEIQVVYQLFRFSSGLNVVRLLPTIAVGASLVVIAVVAIDTVRVKYFRPRRVREGEEPTGADVMASPAGEEVTVPDTEPKPETTETDDDG